ncbi:hypothetical protein Cgig2_028870 [Carnegiea gigantea]|uniref:Uncharacterized protein n=1 Tax=Carnegiea gigantea TaxID=171969 RepID=A0A9Q1KQV2_9CARY|nr:hypothetical protein Cgig2_028870 [Carnegiea gigantea]
MALHYVTNDIEVHIEEDHHDNEEILPLQNIPPPDAGDRNPTQEAISQAFQSTAHLANLLPIGTVMAFHLAPIFTNEDFLPAFMPVHVFTAITLLDKSTVQCYHPMPTKEDQEILTALPLNLGAMCNRLFVAFRTKHHGIGFPLTALFLLRLTCLCFIMDISLFVTLPVVPCLLSLYAARNYQIISCKESHFIINVIITPCNCTQKGEGYAD